VGAVLGQGSSGAGLASQRNLDEGVNSYFVNSVDEDVYGEVRLQPLLFVDDLIRSTTSVMETRAGNIKLDTMIKEKSLGVHSDKSGYLVCGPKKFKEHVEEETKDDPIMFGQFPLQHKSVKNYLGDQLSDMGLADSVEVTILARVGKGKGAIYELAAVCADYRMQVVGGMIGAIDIWNVCIVSSLLSNFSVWTEISKKSKQYKVGCSVRQCMGE
jgi:hypothetical protein